MQSQQTPHTAYDVIDFIPVKGLVRSPYDELTRESVFSHVVNLVSNANLGLWQAREGQRAFKIIPLNGGTIEPDTLGNLLSGIDAGNYAVGEIYFRKAYRSGLPYRELVKYVPWVAWYPRLPQDLLSPQPGLNGPWVGPYDYLPEEYDPTEHALLENPALTYSSLLFFLQRGTRNIDQLPWLTITPDPTLRTGTLYCYLLPAIEDNPVFRKLQATLGRLQGTIDERYGWAWTLVHSADWSWVSPIGTYTFGRLPGSYRVEEPYKSLALSPYGPFQFIEWDADSFTDPLYWTGRVLSLGHYTVVTHGGMLREYWEKGYPDEHNVQVFTPFDGGGPSRHSYLIGDLLLYDGSSVLDEEQREGQYEGRVIVQENAVGRVGNDILALDLRIAPGQENDASAGIEGPLTLYKFYADFGYTLPLDIEYPRSAFDVIKDNVQHEKVPGWFSGKSLYRSDTGRGYFQKTYTPKIGIEEPEIIKDEEYIEIEGIPTDFAGAWGTFTRNGFTWTGYDPEAWNDAAHKMLVKNLFDYWFMESWAPDMVTWTGRSDNTHSVLNNRRYYMRLDRIDGNHILYTKTLWGSGKRPFIAGWTALLHVPQSYKSDEVTTRPASFSNAVVVDNDYRHIVTNSTEARPFPNLLSPVILFNPATSKQTDVGEKDTDFEFDVLRAIASNTYRWGEFPVRYYPCSGRLRGSCIMTHYDRLWDRTDDGPRTFDVSIPKETSPECLLPVSGWSYRFVYEYHDGTFSAPSPVYQAPTLLFSEISDAEIEELTGGNYQRPLNYGGDGTELVWHEDIVPYLMLPKYFIKLAGTATKESYDYGVTLHYPVLTGALAKIASYWSSLRAKIFPDGHPYTSIELPDLTANPEQYLEYVDKFTAQFTLITLYDEAGQHSYKTPSMMGEGLCLAAASLFSFDDFDENAESSVIFRFIKVFGCIPFVPIEGVDASLNSLFTYPSSPYGAYYRMTYRRYPKYQLVNQKPVFEWDYLAEGGRYFYFPDWCLRTGGTAGSVSLDSPGQLAKNWATGESYLPPLFLPLIPLNGNLSFESGGTPLVLPSGAYRRAIWTTPWSSWDETSDAFPMNIPQGQTQQRETWIGWAEDKFPYGPSERTVYTYLQWCWEGENLTMSPVRWGTLPDLRPDGAEPEGVFRMRGWFIDGSGIPPFEDDGVATLPPMLGFSNHSLSFYNPADFNNDSDVQLPWFNLFAAQNMFHHHPLHSNTVAEAYGSTDDNSSYTVQPGNYFSATVDKMGRNNSATSCGLWNVLNEQNVAGIVDKLVYLNVICPLWDKNNEFEDWNTRPVLSDVIPDTETIRYRLRIPSVIRYMPTQAYTYGTVRAGIPAAVIERLILDGIAPLTLATSRFREPNSYTPIGFAGTTRTYWAHAHRHAPAILTGIPPTPTLPRKDSFHDTMTYRFTETERKGKTANVPHLKSRWAPVVTGHALATFPNKYTRFYKNEDDFSDRYVDFLGWIGGKKLSNDGFDTPDAGIPYNTTLNLYSRSRTVEPHLMHFDGALWASWLINYTQATTDASDERHGNIHLKENPRKMPFWSAYIPNVGSENPPTLYQSSVRDWFKTFIFLRVNRDFTDSMESLTTPPITGGIDYPVYGESSSQYPLANRNYPPSPFNTFLNNFWKYVPLQNFVCLNAEKDWDGQKFWFYKDTFWVRPYWFYNLMLSRTTDGTGGFSNVGIPSSLADYFTNYPQNANLDKTIVVVQFPTDGSGQYVFPATSSPKATIIAHGKETERTTSIPIIQRDAYRLSYGISDLWIDDAAATVNSMDIVVYMRGFRALFVEQLTMYKTAKAIFDSPRLGLWFRKEAIPPRVKRIHIYRTRHIDDNAWHPDQFGYVGSVDCKWEYDESGARTNDLYFFDNTPDARLDFGDDITRFEALESGLSSVAATILSERAYYGNIRERYSPLRPAAFSVARGEGWGVCAMDTIDFSAAISSRSISQGGTPRQYPLFPGFVFIKNAPQPPLSYMEATPQVQAEMEDFWGSARDFMVASADMEGFLSEVHQPYMSPCREGSRGLYGQLISLPTTPDYDSSGAPTQYVCAGFYGISHPVDNIEITLIWHSTSLPPGYSLPRRFRVACSVSKSGGGTAIDYGVTKKSLRTNWDFDWPWFVESEGKDEQGQSYTYHFPCGKDIIYNYKSAVRWSDLRTPHVIRGSNIEFVREGDGDEILALVPTYNGNLLVFKRNSIVRLMLAGGFEIARRDQVSDTHGIISPNAWCVYKNLVFFVSRDGIYAYDDNVLNKVDGPISDEILARLQRNDNSLRDPATNLTSATYNHLRGELYFNIPVGGPDYAPYLHMYGGIFQKGKPALHGHVFDLNFDSMVWTKLQYPSLTELNSTEELGQLAPGSDMSGFLHLARNYYRDSRGRFWSIPVAPSTWSDGGQLYLEGPHGADTRWKMSYDDVFGEFSFQGTPPNSTIVPYSPSLAPPENIYVRPVRSLWALGGYRADQGIKTKLRQYAILGYWRNNLDNFQYYTPQYDQNMGYEPSLVSTVGLQDYVQGYGSQMSRQVIAYKYGWFTSSIPNANGLLYNPVTTAFNAQTTQLAPSDFLSGAEWTAVLSGVSVTALKPERAEVWYIYGETWGSFVLKGVRAWLRPAELWLR